MRNSGEIYLNFAQEIRPNVTGAEKLMTENYVVF